MKYRIWGDQVTEDYYFYPDGFGTRNVTLTSVPGADYELSEFIVSMPLGTLTLRRFPAR